MRMSDKKYLIALFTILIIHFAVFADSVHKVEKGDTLYSISRKYQITVAELRAANNLSENDVIKIGQKLIIPTADITTAVALAADNSQKKDNDKPATTSTTNASSTSSGSTGSGSKASSADSVYVVEKGDTLYGIARKNGITVAELMSINNLNSSDVIKVGQKLKIKAVTTISSSTNNSNSTSSTSTSSTSKATSTSSTSSSSPATSDTPDTRNYGVTVAADSSIVWPVVNPNITTVE